MTKPNLFKKTVWIGILFMMGIFSLPVFSAELGDTPISKFDVFDADIREVFRSLGELDELNVLMDPGVKGLVNIKIKAGLTVKEAIEMLAQTNGFSTRWITASRTVLIGNEKTFTNFESRETRVYRLTYAKPDQIVNTLKVLVPADQMGVDARTNQLTIRASILTQQNIAEIITSLDREMAQITIDVRVEEIKKSALDKAGVNWAASDFNINFTDLTISGTASHLLQLWEERSEAKLLSNPMISTTDSQEGTVFIGDRYPMVVTNSETTGTTYSIQYIDIGTKLSVTPRINSDNIVTVNVKANVSSLTEYVSAGENQIPVVRNRDISSVIRLRDGETFVLSGLNEINSVTTTDRIKGLGSLPLIGWLFKQKITDPNDSTEICIFITPKIIHTGVAEANSVKIGPDTNNQPKQTPTPEATPSPSLPIPAPSLDSAVQTQSPAVTNETPMEAVQNISTPDNSAKVTETGAKTAETANNTKTPQQDSTSGPSQSQDQSSELSVNANPDNPMSKKLIIEPSSAPQAGHSKVTVGMELTVTLKPGETLSQIAQKYGVTPASILKENNLHTAAELKPGQPLLILIPSSHLYVLKPKETLWRLAMRYSTTVNLLMEINHIGDISKVEAGQIIILPVAGDKVANRKY